MPLAPRSHDYDEVAVSDYGTRCRAGLRTGCTLGHGRREGTGRAWEDTVVRRAGNCGRRGCGDVSRTREVAEPVLERSIPADLDDSDELAFLESATPAEQDNDSNILRHQFVTSPLLTYSAVKHRAADFPSRGLLGTSAGERVYVNTNAPSSAVICGVQGSGKSHTVSCLLESTLIADPRIGQLPEPLSALVFHFDTQDTGRPCEAAFLSSPATHGLHATLPQVTVLCSPSNVSRRRRAYSSLAQVRVEPLYLSERDLTVDRMLTIMGCDNLDAMPLYMHTALLIIRNMGVDAFSYLEFKRRIGLERLDATQKAMLKLRLDLLDAFIRPGAREIESYFAPGRLVIIDLTDSFLDGLTAAVLFDSVLGSFTQWQTACGKLVVLDEAHKYFVNSDSARLTQSVSNIIRLQRHMATRVIIATQEPTVIPPTILDLASIIICHRFSSPAWCTHLERHVSAGSESSASWYQQVMLLATGDALVFSPAAVLTADDRGGVVLLGRDHLKLRVRPRLTLDGGASLLAVGRTLPALPVGSAASPLSLPEPSASESYLSGLEETTSAPSVPALNPTSTPWDTPFAAFNAPATSAAVSPAAAPTLSTPPAGESTVPRPAPHKVPARLKPLMGWLSRNGAAKAPAKLDDARAELFWVGKKDVYAGLKGKQWWTQMLQEAVEEGLIELINMDDTKEELRARGEEKMIRLLKRGPLVYV